MLVFQCISNSQAGTLVLQYFPTARNIKLSPSAEVEKTNSNILIQTIFYNSRNNIFPIIT